MIVVALKFLLWKFSFTAKVNGFFTFSEIMLRVPLQLNFAVLFRIERVRFTFSITSRMLKISTYGVQVTLLVRNDFNLWATRKIEILQILEDIRMFLKRKGQLKSTLAQAASSLKKTSVEYFGHALKEPNAESGANGNTGNNKKKFVERMLDKVLTSFEVDMSDTIINFFAYKDEDKKIEEANIKKFYHSYLLDPEFCNQNLCFRVFIPSTQVCVKSLDEEELDLIISAETVLLQNPTVPNRQGILRKASILVKVPLDLKLAQDVCNFDMRINILRGSLNVNKRFIRAITKFLVYMDTTKVIINRIKRLIIKLHYQDELLNMMQQSQFTTGVETLYQATDGYNYENIKDVDIPKRLKVVIEEGLTLIVSEYSKKLRPFLNGGLADEGGRRESELIVLNTNQLTFELLRTLKDSYYVSCQSDKISIDCNMNKSITIENFFQETDFSYKRPISSLPISVSKMEISNSIKAESLEVNLTFSEIKLVLDIVDIYQEMVSIASVKNVIMSTLLDREFLKSNLLHLGNTLEDQVKESQIMLLFQEPRFKDSLVNDVLLSKISGKFITYDPRQSINISGQKYQMRLKAVKSVDEFINKIAFLNIQPANPKAISILKLQGMENVIAISRGNDTNIKDIAVNFEKCHLCLNLDYILGLTKEILDLTVIVKTYTRKWNFKYKVKEFIKQSIVESLTFDFHESQLIWYMSASRFLVFKFSDFSSRPLQCPFKKDDKIGLCYFSRELSLFHVQNIVDNVIPGTYFCDPSEEKKISGLLDIKEIEFKMLSSERELKMRYTAKSAESNLPEEVHFCGLIFEMVKQLMVSRKWFKQEYIKMKRKHNLQFQKPPPLNKQPFSISQQMVPATQGRKQTLSIQVEVQDMLLQADDAALKQVFVNKNEIVDTLKERDLFKCKGHNIFKLLKKLKQSKLNEKQMQLQGKNFKMLYDMPEQFLEFNQVYQMIQRLDEAKDFMNPGLFKSFEGAIHSYSCDYVAMHGRNFIQPLVEAWDVEVKFLIVVAILNDEHNPLVFKTKISDKIFNKYEVQYYYNKLLPKIFYDGDLKIQKLKASIQGQQTFLFINDLGNVFKKFGYEDISKSKDPRGQKLSYYSGLDFIRHKMHGKTKAQVTIIEVQVYPKRKFNRYDSYLSCSFTDLIYFQQHNYQELAFRNLTLSKFPLRSFESAILKIPLIEIQLNIIYNQGKTVNHYTHVGVQQIGQLLEQLSAYSSHEVELDAKINIPSLGTRNESDREATPISQMIPLYVQQSPIPIMHYQRSHMKFFDSLLQEYLKKRQYANSIPLKKDRDFKLNLKNKRAYLFKVRIKALINDLMILFTDFKEKLTDGYHFENQGRMDSKQMKINRDKYLAIYQGIMFTMENMSFKAQVSVFQQKDGTHIEMKNSGIQSNFMKLAFMNSSNLYQIRHPCFKQLRDRQFDYSLDNHKHFLHFFEINLQSTSQNSQANSYLDLQQNSILASFKTINPQYLVKNPSLQQEIMIATLNPNSMNPLYNMGNDPHDMNFCRHQTILDDFVFANTDTIQTIILLKYSQDQDISFYHNSTQKMEERQQEKQRQQNPLILDVLPASNLGEEKFTVKHMIDVKGIRFLYTKQTIELIIHHLINSFDYEKYRKTDFIDIENSQDKYHYGLQGGKRSQGEQNSSNSKTEKHENQTPINIKNLRKVALIGLRVEDPQINFQNQFTKSQMLLSTAQPTTAIIFGYHKFQQPTLLSSGNTNQAAPNQQKSVHLGEDELQRSKSGYQFKFHEELVKVDLQIQVVEMDIYVAPTVINLENPTFWVSNFQDPIVAMVPQSDKLGGGATIPPLYDRGDHFHSENLLRKIFSVTNISFTFDFFFAQFVDLLNPVMAIDILIEKLDSEMSGPNMWHFVYVLKSILFDRGEKADEILDSERKRMDEMNKIKLDIIKSLIDYKIGKGLTVGSESAASRHIINKKIQYTILNGEFKLQNNEQMFARVDVTRIQGTHLIYKNRNSKVDIDIDKILIENYADSEAYRTVLSQCASNQSADPTAPSGDAMIKIRTRDKYVIVTDAPWRVYDQFEVFIFPTSIQFTKNFYQQIRNFFFVEMPTLDLDRSMEEIKKYDLLVPKKVLKKAQAKYKAKAKDTQDNGKLTLSAFPDNQSVVLRQNNGVVGAANNSDYSKNLNAAMHLDDRDNYYLKDQRVDVAPPDDNIVKTEQVKTDFPIYFRYTRMNEVIVSITYFHQKNSFFNTKDLKIKLSPFIRHGKFVNFKRLFEKYEHHCKKNFIKQIPSLIKQKFLQTRETFKGVKGAENYLEDDDDDEKMENKKEIKLHNARRILFGEYFEP